MTQISLKKIVNKRELLGVLIHLINSLDITIYIEDLQGERLLSTEGGKSASKYPVEVSGEIFGWVFGDEKVATVASLLSYLAKQELEKKGLANELLDKYQEIDWFHDISTQITANLELKKVAKLVIEEAGKLSKSTNGLILLLNQNTGQLEILSELGQADSFKEPIILGEGVIGTLVQTGKAEIINDISADPRFDHSQESLCSLICVPLKAKEQVIGAIAVLSETLVTYSAEDLKRLTMLSLQAAVAIENALLHEKQLQESHREALIFQLTNQIHHSLNLDTILETAVSEIKSFLQIDHCLFSWQCPPLLCIDKACPVNFYSCKENPLTWEVVHEARNPELPSLIGHYSSAEMGMFTEELLHLGIFQIDDLKAFPAIGQSSFASDFTSVLALPIQTRSGAVGILSCGNTREPRTWSEHEVKLLQLVATQLTIALDQAELYEQTRTAAFVAQTQTQQLQQTLYELKHTQTQLIQSEKMSSLGQLVAGVAHEINNPVNFICGNLNHANQYTQDLLQLLSLYQQHYPQPVTQIQTLSEDIELEFLIEDLPKLLASMHMGVERIRQLVLSLRNFSRLDQAEMKPVDIHEGIDSTLLILQNRMKPNGGYPGIKVIKEYGNLPQVECYAGQMNQVFMNILANAIDALENQKQPGIITIRTSVAKQSLVMGNGKERGLLPITEHRSQTTNQQFIVILIQDNGPGISEAIQSRLFDPFFTTKPVGKGTGLGLSISHQIVEKHGGLLKCLSRPRQGATFSIQIPIKPLTASKPVSRAVAALSQ